MNKEVISMYSKILFLELLVIQIVIAILVGYNIIANNKILNYSIMLLIITTGMSYILNRTNKYESIIKINNFFFQIMLILFILIMLIGTIWSNLILINLSYILMPLIITGTIFLLTKNEKKSKERKITKKEHTFSIILSIIFILLMYLKTKELTLLRGVSILFLGTITYFTSLVLLRGEITKEDLIEISNKKIILIIITILMITSITLFLLTGISGLRIIWGTVYLFFLPGFSFSYIIFRNKEIDKIERIIFSFILSIIIVPLVIFYLNYMGVKLSILNILLIITSIIIIPILINIKKIRNVSF